jgi:hypothetical protein
MSTLVLTASGRADPAEAWERYAQPARWSEWSPQISRVEVAADRLVAGLTGRVVGPLGVSIDFVVDSVDEDARTWRWTVHRGPLTLHLAHGVTAEATGSATSLQLEGPLPVILGYAPLARFALGRLVRP